MAVMELNGTMERYCGAASRQTGEPCRKPAGWGTPSKFGRCKLHGGATATGKAQLARVAKMAIDAGVAERMVRIAEGTGERLASALEEALEGVELPPGQRQVVVQRFAASLSRLEREQPAITAKAESV
jgi:hypothetical protein